jgi:hypothetical protein
MASSAETRIAIDATLGTLRLELLVEDASLSRARVVISTKPAGDVWSGEATATRVDGGAIVTVDVPAERLHAAAYDVTVLREPGGAKAGAYYFTVHRQ